MDDKFDVDLVDHSLLEELEWTAELMVAGSNSDAPLSQDEVDRILGVTSADSGTRLARGIEHDA